MFNRPRIVRALALLFVTIPAACSDTESPLSPYPDGTYASPAPSLSISDGAHGGNEHFYFLPPLVKRPSTPGTFDPTQSPVVVICELGRGICLNKVATYTMDAGPENDRIRVNEKREEYAVEWGAQRLPVGTEYRIHVGIGETELGHLDVLLTAKKQKSTDDWVKIKAGSAVDIRFRIEEGALPSAGDIVLHDNVVPVDSTVLTLVSTESELAAGAYRFDVIGSPVPHISVGDVLAGPEGLGFMRIVTSVKVTGKRVVAETTQATLSDIIKEGGFSISAPLDLSGASAPPPSGSVMAPLYYMAAGVSAAGRLFTLAGVDLCDEAWCPEWLSLTLPSGYVDFTSTVDWDYEARLSLTDPVDRFKVVVKSALVFDVTAEAVASQAFSADSFATLVTVPVPIPLPGILWFLRARADVKLKVGYEANATVEARVKSGIHMESGLEMGGEYTHSSGGWTAIWNPTFNVAAKETSWAAQGNGDIRVYVRPEVQLVVSRIEGPYAGVEPYLKAYGAVGTEGCRVRLTWAADADVVLTAKVGKTQLPTLPKKWPGTETEIVPSILCPVGHLKVVTTTNGTSPDPDGYTVTLDGIDPKPAPTNGTVMYSPLPPTTYKVELTGLAENCSVTSNPRDIIVSEGDTTLVAFPVTCGEPETGILQVSTTTTGQDDGYTVTTDGASPSSQPIGIESQVTFDPVIAGDRTVELTGLGPNCTVAGDNPRTVTVAPGATATTDFDVTCGLTVSVTTIGSQFDPDGYTVDVDAGSLSALVDINGSVWLEIAVGTHDLELTDLADGCTVTGENPRNIDSPGEESFDVTCGPAITFQRDSNVWQILPDGNGLQQLTTAAGPAAVSWSPDGTRMVFARYTSNCATSGNDCSAIFASDADGSNAVQLTLPEAGVLHRLPDWSSDGTSIVFDQVQESPVWMQSVVTMNPDGTNKDTVRAGDGTTNFAFPSWTPDGRITHAERVTGENSDDTYLAIMNADGSGSQRLTSIESARVYDSDYSSGHRIAFRRKLYLTQPSFDLMLIDADGLNLTNLSNQTFSVRSLEWSPDGGQIAYTLEDAAGGVWLVDADGSNRIQLTDGTGSVAWRTLPSP